ncbi:hypothetical protein [Nonomuraea cavernae]|uniref:Uncharacterized protein n=1 Tax=Nonomuraea cavernae TaxID=2045107 RepID=A0A917ZHP2_9ACTN|nr:hypothetical protein [Nonomuraea cavernae]MCA2190728.1 hypothetical protein [Nonomuraea cavernae]GGO82037.1 hypothetical protein GCM10012289_72350 [Nonomuraea cavernae]
MSTNFTRGLELPYLYQELVSDRIQTLHREAEEQRLISRIRRVRRAERGVRRANERLSQALSRGV